MTSHYKGNASSGMCPLPYQVVKHLTGDVLDHMAAFLTRCVARGMPPATCSALKLVPIFKKGDHLNPDYYRALAVGHPLAKLSMGVINKRLTAVATKRQLQAPT